MGFPSEKYKIETPEGYEDLRPEPKQAVGAGGASYQLDLPPGYEDIGEAAPRLGQPGGPRIGPRVGGITGAVFPPQGLRNEMAAQLGEAITTGLPEAYGKFGKEIGEALSINALRTAPAGEAEPIKRAWNMVGPKIAPKLQKGQFPNDGSVSAISVPDPEDPRVQHPHDYAWPTGVDPQKLFQHPLDYQPPAPMISLTPEGPQKPAELVIPRADDMRVLDHASQAAVVRKAVQNRQVVPPGAAKDVAAEMAAKQPHPLQPIFDATKVDPSKTRAQKALEELGGPFLGPAMETIALGQESLGSSLPRAFGQAFPGPAGDVATGFSEALQQGLEEGTLFKPLRQTGIRTSEIKYPIDVLGSGELWANVFQAVANSVVGFTSPQMLLTLGAMGWVPGVAEGVTGEMLYNFITTEAPAVAEKWTETGQPPVAELTQALITLGMAEQGVRASVPALVRPKRNAAVQRLEAAKQQKLRQLAQQTGFDRSLAESGARTGRNQRILDEIGRIDAELGKLRQPSPDEDIAARTKAEPGRNLEIERLQTKKRELESQLAQQISSTAGQAQLAGREYEIRRLTDEIAKIDASIERLRRPLLAEEVSAWFKGLNEVPAGDVDALARAKRNVEQAGRAMAPPTPLDQYMAAQEPAVAQGRQRIRLENAPPEELFDQMTPMNQDRVKYANQPPYPGEPGSDFYDPAAAEWIRRYPPGAPAPRPEAVLPTEVVNPPPLVPQMPGATEQEVRVVPPGQRPPVAPPQAPPVPPPAPPTGGPPVEARPPQAPPERPPVAPPPQQPGEVTPREARPPVPVQPPGPERPGGPVAPPAPTEKTEPGRPPAGPGDELGRAGGGGPRPVSRTNERIVTARADVTEDVDTSELDPTLVRHLTDYQQQGAAKAIKAIDTHGGFLLADGTGVGKTREILTVASHYAKRLGKRVLIVTQNSALSPQWQTGQFFGSYADDAKAMGVKIGLAKGDKILKPGEIGLTTYHRLQEFRNDIIRGEKMPFGVDSDTIVIFDESHHLKNSATGTGWALVGTKMAKDARGVLFASATPVDKPQHLEYLIRAGASEGKSVDRAFEDLGLYKARVRVPNGPPRSIWKINPRVTGKFGTGAAEVYGRMSELFHRLTQRGRMIQRELSWQGVEVEFAKIPLPDEAYRDMDAIHDFIVKHKGDSGIWRAQILMHQRRQQEPHKIATVVRMVQDELGEGRQVIVYIDRIHASEVGVNLKDPYTGDILRKVLMTSEGTAPSLKKALVDAGLKEDDIAEIHGESEHTKEDAQYLFQTGRRKVLLATMPSGGAGINLDDRVGNAPRSMIIMTAPFSGIENIQAAGRIWRLPTKSGVRVRYVFSDTQVDEINAQILTNKMQMLGAVVKGETRALNIPENLSIKDVEEWVGRKWKGGEHPTGPRTEYKPPEWQRPEPPPIPEGVETKKQPPKKAPPPPPEPPPEEAVSVTPEAPPVEEQPERKRKKPDQYWAIDISTKHPDPEIEAVRKRAYAADMDVKALAQAMDEARSSGQGQDVIGMYAQKINDAVLARSIIATELQKIVDQKAAPKVSVTPEAPPEPVSVTPEAPPVEAKPPAPEAPKPAPKPPTKELLSLKNIELLERMSPENKKLAAEGQKPTDLSDPYAVEFIRRREKHAAKRGVEAWPKAEAKPEEPAKPTVPEAKPTEAPAPPKPSVKTEAIPAETKAEAIPVEPPKGKTVEAKTSGNQGKIMTEGGLEAKYAYSIVDAEEPLTSHDDTLAPNAGYDRRLQNRTVEENAKSAARIADMANQLDPARLGLVEGGGSRGGEGAPVLGDHGMIEAGNHRVIAIRRAYREGLESAKAYKEAILARADEFGLDAEAIEGMEMPILVRKRISDVKKADGSPATLEEWAQELNRRGTADLSAPDAARQDAKNITPEMMKLFRPTEEGTLNNPSNLDFVRAFVETIPVEEREKLQSRTGLLTEDGQKRLERAVFAKAYGADNTEAAVRALEAMAEGTGEDAKNLRTALVAVAPKFLSLKFGDFLDLKPEAPIIEATEIFNALRVKGDTVQDFLDQNDIFGGPSEEARAILAIFDKYRKSGKALRGFLESVADVIENDRVHNKPTRAPRQQVLGGETREFPTLQEVLHVAGELFEARQAERKGPKAAEGRVKPETDTLIPGLEPEPSEPSTSRLRAAPGRPEAEAEGGREQEGPGGGVQRPVEALRPGQRVGQLEGAAAPIEPGGEVPSTAGMPMAQPGKGPTYPANVKRPLYEEEKTSSRTTIREIRRQLEKITEAPIYGRGGSRWERGVLGIFDYSVHGIRLKSARDIQSMGHEAGHAIHNLLVLKGEAGTPRLLPDAVRKELIDLGKQLYGGRHEDKFFMREGFAEYTAKFLMGDEMPVQAPAADAWIKSKLAEKYPGKLEALQQAKQAYKTWDEMGAKARISAQIWTIAKTRRGRFLEGVREAGGPKEAAKLAIVELKKYLTTDAAPLEKAEDALLAANGIDPATIPPTLRPSKIREAYRMNAKGTARNFVFDYATNFSGDRVGGSLADALEGVKKDLENFTLYTVAKHAEEIYQHNAKKVMLDPSFKPIDPGIDRADARRVVSELESPEFMAASKKLREWNSFLLDFVAEADGSGPEFRRFLEQNYPYYVPLQRHFEREQVRKRGPAGAGGGEVDIGYPVKRQHGSAARIINPIHSLIANAEVMISAAYKIRVGRAIAELAETVPMSADFAWKVQPPPERVSFYGGQIIKQLQDAHVPIDKMDPHDVLTLSDRLFNIWRNMRGYQPNNNIVSIWRADATGKRKQEFWQVNPLVMETVLGMDGKSISAGSRAVHLVVAPMLAAKRAIQLGATGLNPSFGLISNPARDIQTANIFGRTEARSFLGRRILGPFEYLHGIAMELGKHPDALRWKAVGGELTTLMGQDRAAAHRIIEEALAKTKTEEFKASVKHPIDLTRRIIGFTESATRIKEFSNVLEENLKKVGTTQKIGQKGAGKGEKTLTYTKDDAVLDALLASKNVTVNFTRAGILTGAINQYIPFFNAKVQSTSRFIRAFSGPDRKKAAARMLGAALQYITLPHLALWLAYKDEKWYQERQKWEKGHLVFSFDGGKTKQRLPIPFELGYIFGVLPVEALNQLYVDHPDSEDLKDVVAAVASSLLPFTVGNGLKGMVYDFMPAFAKPGIETLTNYDSFRNQPIVPEYRLSGPTEVSPRMQYNRNTTETFKALADYLSFGPFQISPAKLEHFADAQTGGMALNIARLSDMAIRLVKGIEKTRKDEPPKEWGLGSRVAARLPDVPVLSRVAIRPSAGQSVDDARRELRQLTIKKNSKDPRDPFTAADESRYKILDEAVTRINTILRGVNEGKIDQYEGTKKATDIAIHVLGRDKKPANRPPLKRLFGP